MYCTQLLFAVFRIYLLTACLLFITTINAFAQKQDTIAGIPVNYDESKTGS